jgi:8-amino-7-oxononanoate synthase
MHPLERIEYRIGALKAAGLWRDPGAGRAPSGAGELVDARSNDYLGLAGAPVSRETGGAIGAGASRLISGTHPEHRQLERALADWLGFEDCLLFSSGYAANLGDVSALAGPGETILSDALNHASIIDGCRLSRADVVVLPHRDLGAVERALAAGRGVRWVVTESYFGMDGDSPDLARLRALCDAHGAALVVDEAHAIGVFGPSGRGLCAAHRVLPDVMVGGMGKALGIQGGFAACGRLIRDWLWNRARSMVFSTASSPALCSLALDQVARVRAADSERARLRALESRLADRLREMGVGAPAGRHGPLFPVVLGSEAAVLAGAERARELGVLCHPIRPPTVPRGSSRLRVTLRADMSARDVDRIADALGAAWRERTVEAEAPRVGQSPEASGTQGAPGSASQCRATNASSGELVPAGALDRMEDGAARSDVSPAPAGAERDTGRRHGALLAAGPRDESGASAPAIHARADRRRWIVLGTGTGVGKTFVAQALVRLLADANQPVAGLKPIETGMSGGTAADAAQLGALASHVKMPSPHPLYGFADPITPSRAARHRAVAIDLRQVANWAGTVASTTQNPAQLVIETAGGVFSPLADLQSNFDLAAALSPALWILVAPTRLGVLHDVSSTLHAMAALGRRPDWIVLSAPEIPDASTSSNREELTRLHFMPPVLELPRNDARPLQAVLRAAPQ